MDNRLVHMANEKTAANAAKSLNPYCNGQPTSTRGDRLVRVA